jgi:hypothetical protein
LEALSDDIFIDYSDVYAAAIGFINGKARERGRYMAMEAMKKAARAG